MCTAFKAERSDGVLTVRCKTAGQPGWLLCGGVLTMIRDIDSRVGGHVHTDHRSMHEGADGRCGVEEPLRACTAADGQVQCQCQCSFIRRT